MQEGKPEIQNCLQPGKSQQDIEHLQSFNLSAVIQKNLEKQNNDNNNNNTVKSLKFPTTFFLLYCYTYHGHKIYTFMRD